MRVTKLHNVVFISIIGVFNFILCENENASMPTSRDMRLKKLKDDLNGNVLKVVTLNDYPLSYVERNENGELVGKGVAFRILEFLQEKFNFTTNIHLAEKNIIGSNEDYNGSVVEALNTSKAELAVAFLPLLANMRDLLKYSSSILDEGEWIMIMKRPPGSASGSGLLAPFTNEVWVLILVSLVAVGPIIYGLIVLRYKLTKDRIQKTYPLPHCVWFVYGALMKQGSTLSPIADSTRLIFATWWIFITILTSFYTANLTAFLTLSKFTLPIKKVDDIVAKDKQFVSNRGGGVEYAIRIKNESLYNLMNSMIQRERGIFNTKNDSDNLLDYVESKNYVFIRDRPAIDHLIYQDYQRRKFQSSNDEKKHCPFATAKIPFMKRKRTFAYPISSHYNEIFDPELMYLVESGIVKFMLLDKLPNAEICPQDLGGTERQLRNSDLTMTYWIMLAGFSTAIVVFFTEIVFKCLNRRYHFRQSSGQQNFKVRDKFVSSPFNVTPPPSYATLFNRSRNKLWISDSQTDLIDKTGGVQQYINGRNYIVFRTDGGEPRLVPIRTPSAALFQYAYTK